MKRIARKLMEHIQDRLVLDWRKKAQTREAARVLVKDVLEELPEVYDTDTWQRKTDIVFNHIFASYYDDGQSVYERDPPVDSAVGVVTSPAVVVDTDQITEEVLARIAVDPRLAEQVAERLSGAAAAFYAATTDELVAGEETYAVEFKSTARWNLREGRKDKRMEDAVVKSITGFLNTDGGVLLIGVDDDGAALGLQPDIQVVKPKSADGLVNWLTTHLIGALSHNAVMRTRARIDRLGETEVCRVDVARSSVPVTAQMSDKGDVFWVRMNNSTRALSEIEIEGYVGDHWGP